MFKVPGSKFNSFRTLNLELGTLNRKLLRFMPLPGQVVGSNGTS
jgi:hypothetical protein